MNHQSNGKNCGVAKFQAMEESGVLERVHHLIHVLVKMGINEFQPTKAFGLFMLWLPPFSLVHVLLQITI